MRRAYTEKKWIYTESGELAGIAMGSDFCAEHEWGVGTMKAYLGCDEEKDGVDRRIIHNVPDFLYLIEKKHLTALIMYDSYGGGTDVERRKRTERWLDSELKGYRDERLATAWDEKSFGIAAYGEKDQENVRNLYEAFKRKDIAFWTNIGPFHIGGGLILAIASKIPEENKKEILEADLDYKRLLKVAEETGIEKRLREAGKQWFALSPKWIKDGTKSKYPVEFLLNPYQQNIHRWGYYTVEELEEWIEGKGRVFYTKEELEERRKRR